MCPHEKDAYPCENKYRALVYAHGIKTGCLHFIRSIPFGEILWKHYCGIQSKIQQLKSGESKTTKPLTQTPTRQLLPSCFLSSVVQTKLLTQYILNLGKYDQSYDIRDRTRFIRQLIVPNEKSGALNKYARRILLAPKPAPVLESTFKGISYILMSTYYPYFQTY